MDKNREQGTCAKCRPFGAPGRLLKKSSRALFQRGPSMARTSKVFFSTLLGQVDVLVDVHDCTELPRSACGTRRGFARMVGAPVEVSMANCRIDFDWAATHFPQTRR
jgi:hypothetical protein